MKFLPVIVLLAAILLTGTGCAPAGQTTATDRTTSPAAPPTATTTAATPMTGRPRIASWLAKKDDIIASGKPFSLVMTAWFTPEEAAAIKKNNPDALLLAGLTLNWTWDNQEWLTFLETVASYGQPQPLHVTEDMYLHQPDGSRCPFGWASEDWNQEEIYAMDPRNEGWARLILAFYKNVLAQPQHDGIIVDMVTEASWCPEAISRQDWIDATRNIMARLKALTTTGTPVIFNAGRDYSEIDAYQGFFDGFLMENFLGDQMKTTFEDGLNAAATGLTVIYAVDTDDTGAQDPARMRLGLVLSLLNDNTYFAYDFGPRDHGQAWWFPEYDAELGQPEGAWYRDGDAYLRDYERGTVAAAPEHEAVITFDTPHIDVTTGETETTATVPAGDGRIFLLP